MKRIRVSHRAERDLDAIWLCVAAESHSTDIADRLIASIEQRFALLAGAPESGRTCDEIEEGLRCLPAANYLIYYGVDRSRIRISRVIHGMRDQKSAFVDRSH
jgi:toxin ParE1/3/4